MPGQVETAPTAPLSTTNASVSSAPASEPSVRKEVRETLRPVVVLHRGSKDFGLEKKCMLREGETPEIGGWLRRVKGKNAVGRQFGESQYYVVDETKGLCLIKNDEVKEYLRLEKMLSVTAHSENEAERNSKDSTAADHFRNSPPPVYFFRVVALVGGEQRVWELAAADTSDRDLVVRWTCALQLRSKTYDVLLDLDHEKAVKVALWCQSLYRGFKGRVRAERIRAKRQALRQQTGFGISKMVSGLLGAASGSSSNPTSRKQQQQRLDNDADDEEEEEEEDSSEEEGEEDERSAVANTPSSTLASNLLPLLPSSSSILSSSKAASPFFSSFAAGWRRSLFASAATSPQPSSSSPAGKDTSSTSTTDGVKPSSSSASSSATPRVKFPSDRSLAIVVDARVGSSSGNASLAGGAAAAVPAVVVEDEIWENQRWSAMALRGTVVYRGWSEVALLPTERGGWSDRVGATHWDSMRSVPVPPGWRVVRDWTLDLQSAKCNSEGWQFAQTFAALDANLASGRSNSSASARWLVRRRRWFRVREPLPQPQSPPSTSNGAVDYYAANHSCGELIHAGWLGMRGVATGRWSNCFAFLPRHRHKDTLGVALCYFRKRARVFKEDLSFRYPLDDTVYKLKSVRVKFLDNLCVVSDAMATRDSPGLFSLHLSGEQEPRIFNAHSAEARKQWVEALSHSIAASPGPCYEAIANRRSMRKGAAWELSRASDAVKGIVGGGVRGVKHGLLHIKQRTSTHTSSDGNHHHGGGMDAEMHRAESDPDLAQVHSLREEMRRSDAPWQSAAGSSNNAAAAAVPRKFSTDSVASAEMTLPSKVKPSSSTVKTSDQGLQPANGLPPLPPTPQSQSGQPQGFGAGGGDTTDAEVTSAGEEGDYPQAAIVPQLPKKRRSVKQIISKPFNSMMRSTSDNAAPTPALTLASQQGTAASDQQIALSNSIPPSPERPLGDVTATTGTFEMPPPYENIIFDGYFPVSVDDFDTLFFREEDFTRDLLTSEGKTEIEMEPWTNGITVGSEHRRKYRMPRAGVVPPGPSLHLLTRTQTCPGKGYQVDQVCSCPEMPFGQHFSTDFRNVIVAEGPSKCRVVISQRVTLFKPLMAQSFIRNGTRREIMAYYKNSWTGFTRKWVLEKRAHLIQGGAAAAAAAEAEVAPPPAATVDASTTTTPMATTTNSEDLVALKRLLYAVLIALTLTLLLTMALLVHSFNVNARLARVEEELIVALTKSNRV